VPARRYSNLGAQVLNFQPRSGGAFLPVRMHGNATIGVKVVPTSRGWGMEAGTVLFGEERFHYTTCKRHLHTKMS
jgi:hypothetical protein